MVDLTGLTRADVVVRVASTSSVIYVGFAGQEIAERCQPDMQSLKSQDIFVARHGETMSAVFPGGYDKIQLAERLALHFESKGLAVQRLVSDPAAKDKTPSLAVQSFILA